MTNLDKLTDAENTQKDPKAPLGTKGTMRIIKWALVPLAFIGLSACYASSLNYYKAENDRLVEDYNNLVEERNEFADKLKEFFAKEEKEKAEAYAKEKPSEEKVLEVTGDEAEVEEETSQEDEEATLRANQRKELEKSMEEKLRAVPEGAQRDTLRNLMKAKLEILPSKELADSIKVGDTLVSYDMELPLTSNTMVLNDGSVNHVYLNGNMKLVINENMGIIKKVEWKKI
ncbi:MULTISPECIES: hypothetical protein [Bacillus cereus group]|uniref:hypothetical protein n=1 Tax=Bacillus cereus group TaxID=86661 RepID=UPI000BEB3635|nr:MULTISPECIES: hypothetical protein [Bacillus cereus group]MDF3552667.1 hypothetical protein [Bacillus cereus]NIL32573.1 hypothetical protein [Bacillus thuringiensis]PEC34471.1 hypothetical protein COM99_06240 [Bacillus cereus]PEY36201.1 hypothetical protein CN347_13285 [Bacillus cereus]PFJ73831.1 hypothetical protein COJ08_22100 [Bacillus cereus]